ncbi:MAG: tetratricopeptide repeat protein [Candidatus Omnitrophota bacterium]|nr:MAG: tetratricopeptide repeat protein [Candidatus Omnitrophota bacterium]
MRIFWACIIFCLSFTTVSFAQSKKTITNLYSSYLKGLFYTEEENYRTALKYLEKARKLDPDSFLIRLRIATLLIRVGEIEKAEKELMEAKKLNAESFDASLALIFLYSYTENDEALEKEYEHFLEKAHTLDPSDLQVSQHLAQFYFYKNQYQEAIKVYEKILEDNYDDVDAIFWLGFLYEEIGNRQQAIDTWKRGLEIDSSHAPILNSLGYVYVQEGINLDEAESMIKKALKQEPENGAYLDSLGWVYFKKKDFKKAEKYLKKAVEAVKDPVIFDHIGDFYVDRENIEEAVKFYKEGAELFPDNDTLQRKLKKYEEKIKTLKK